ncbi:uncharacterized protein LOC110998993 [Pieris rapae]|uniref:uncharacterized protein LOC110998993 n=1 Tax=Pieris rapae TaxID=64459 RepID=UPI001E27E160|nr:uncharacterized protein LOC110998993 [Pieris rapae]
MNLYKYILMACILDNLYLIENVVIDKGVNISPCSIGLEFYVTLEYVDDSTVEVRGDQCCLVEDGQKDCDELRIVGGCYDYIPHGTPKTLVLIAPILNPIHRNGYCSIFVDTKASDHTNKRDIVLIEFDTTANETNDIKICKNADEDPLNDCKPVDCDSFHNTKKPFYHPKYKRCVEVPRCEDTAIYNPLSNECVEESISDDDIEYLKQNDGKVRNTKDILIIQNRMNETSVSHNEAKPPKITPPRNVPADDTLYFKMLVRKCFVGHNSSVIILSFIVVLQCGLIFALLYCIAKSCTCFKEKKVVRKFFNYRQDATVTTPLINTSNMDTEIDYQFLSDSSKVDQKIKCYKACQKETENVRASMSDDILSKCLNRRDWKHTRSDTIPEDAENDMKRFENDNKEIKVMFEDEIKHAQTSTEKRDTSEKSVEVNRSSEKEIRCHNYVSNVPSFNQNINTRYVTEQPRRTISKSTEKGAQAYFSNDSLDEYLSERGMIYLAGENVSKYTFTSNSTENKPSTPSMSSKTSKNIVQKVLSMMHKKSKVPLSDPGKKELDLQLLHMSKGTVYSSSNDSEYRAYRKKDSRTSL